MMTAQEWEAIGADAAAGLAEAGQPVTIEAQTWTGPANDRTRGAPVLTQAVAVEGSFSARQIDGDLIRVGDRLFYVSAPGVTDIRTDMVLVVGGERLSIVQVMKTAPGGVTVLYQVQTRGAA